MSINIWLPIVLNVVSALIIVSSVLLALKRSLKVSIAKLIMVCGAIVACYFATPVHYEALNNIPFVAETLNNAGIILVDDVVIAIKSVLFIAAFGLSLIVVLSVTSIINSINVKRVEKKLNDLHKNNKAISKPAQPVGEEAQRLAKQTEKETKKALVLAAKAKILETDVGIKIIKVVVGLMLGVITVLVVMLPIKDVFVAIANDSTNISDEVCQALPVAFDKTLAGLIDNWINYTSIAII